MRSNSLSKNRKKYFLFVEKVAAQSNSRTSLQTTRFSSGNMQRVMKLQRFVFIVKSLHDIIHRVFQNVFFKGYTRNKAVKYVSDILSEMT